VYLWFPGDIAGQPHRGLWTVRSLGELQRIVIYTSNDSCRKVAIAGIDYPFGAKNHKYILVLLGRWGKRCQASLWQFKPSLSLQKLFSDGLNCFLWLLFVPLVRIGAFVLTISGGEMISTWYGEFCATVLWSLFITQTFLCYLELSMYNPREFLWPRLVLFAQNVAFVIVANLLKFTSVMEHYNFLMKENKKLMKTNKNIHKFILYLANLLSFNLVMQRCNLNLTVILITMLVQLYNLSEHSKVKIKIKNQKNSINIVFNFLHLPKYDKGYEMTKIQVLEYSNVNKTSQCNYERYETEACFHMTCVNMNAIIILATPRHSVNIQFCVLVNYTFQLYLMIVIYVIIMYFDMKYVLD